jgi:hypothetical protein
VDEALRISALVAVATAAVFQTIFVVLYFFKGTWRDHFVGKALLSKSTTFLAILYLALINRSVEYPGQELITAVVLWLTVLAIVAQLLAFIAQRWPGFLPDWLGRRVGARD